MHYHARFVRRERLTLRSVWKAATGPSAPEHDLPNESKITAEDESEYDIRDLPAGEIEVPVTRRDLGTVLMALGVISILIFIIFATNQSADVEERIARYALLGAVAMALIWLGLKRKSDPKKLAIGMLGAAGFFLLMLALIVSRLL